MARTYPTDVLIALDHLAATADESLRPYLDPAALRGAADVALGGLSQWPWSPLFDRPAVLLLRPIGTVRIEGADDVALLRGLIFALLTGNEVVLPDSWSRAARTLDAAGVPLPAIHFDDRDALTVPVPPGPASLLLDARSAWVAGLSERELLADTTLIRVRAADTAEAAGRLAARVRFIVRQARRSPVYAGLPGTTTDLADLPVLEKETLAAASFPNSTDLLPSGTPRTGEVLRSGGSSGTPRYVVYSRDDWDNMVREAVHMFYELGVEPGDRVINTLFGGGMYGGLLTSACELSRMPIENYVLAQGVRAEDLINLVDPAIGANTLLAQPALIMPLLRKALADGLKPGLRTVLYGGTPMAASDKAWLRAEVGVERLASILAANDGAQIGFQCAHLTGTAHHVVDDFNLVEIIDDAGTPLPLGEYGDIAITTLTKWDGPLVRYRIGDFGRLLAHDCPCGLPGPVLEFAGRSDGLVKIMGRRFTVTALHEALEPFGVSIAQVVITSTGRTEKLTVRAEAGHELSPADIDAHLRANFAPFAERTDFDAGLDVFGFAVETYADGDLDRDPVSGKVRTVLDQRI
ncbi:MAG TPA: hypothetical protein VGJ45_40120 [Pseudonocardiaceae bacterium]|jgi:phenylacetate-CoA ligase